MGPSHSLVQLRSFLDLEFPTPWTAKKRPPGASALGTGRHEVHHEGVKSFNKLGELHMGPSRSLIQLRSFLDLELPLSWTARKRPPGASTLGTGRHEVHHEGVKSFNKLGELHMGPSKSLVQLHSFQDLELPQPRTARKRPKGVSTLGTGHHE